MFIDFSTLQDILYTIAKDKTCLLLDKNIIFLKLFYYGR